MLDGRLLPGATVLVSVVDAGSIARAGEALNLSASAVSRAVSRLEDRVGVRLLERTTRKISLTEEGHRFYEAVKPLLAGIEEAAFSVSGTREAVRGRLRVNVEPFLAREILAPRMPDFLEQFPDLRVDLLMRDSIKDLVADGFDLALRCGEPPLSTLVSRKVLDTRVMTVASPKYIARHGKPRLPSDLQHHTAIMMWDASNREPFQWELHKGKKVIPVSPIERILVSDVGAMIAHCLAGAGIAQILHLGSGHLVASGQLVEIFPEWSDERYPIHIIHPSRKHQPAKVKAFVTFATTALKAASAH